MADRLIKQMLDHVSNEKKCKLKQIAIFPLSNGQRFKSKIEI